MSGRVIRTAVLAFILQLGGLFVTPVPTQAIEESALDLSAESERPWIHRDATGSGFVIPDLNLWVAGYASIALELPLGRPNEGKIDTAGLLLRYEPFDALALVFEGEVEDSLAWVEGERLGDNAAEGVLDRLHLDYTVTPDLTLRLGKFLTPFGLWNEVRRAPLTWTVERPIVTEELFPVHTTGPSLIFNTTRQGWTIDAIAYAQPQSSLAEGDEKTADLATGARAALGRTVGAAYLAVGSSLNVFEEKGSDRWVQVYGADFDLTGYGHHLTGEFAYADLPEPDEPREWGLYLQDVLPITGELYGVLRYEHFDSREKAKTDGWLAGLAWRKGRFVFKANYQYTDSRTEALLRGFLFEFAFYF